MANLVPITSTIWFMVYRTSIHGVYKPASLGGHHLICPAPRSPSRSLSIASPNKNAQCHVEKCLPKQQGTNTHALSYLLNYTHIIYIYIYLYLFIFNFREHHCSLQCATPQLWLLVCKMISTMNIHKPCSQSTHRTSARLPKSQLLIWHFWSNPSRWCSLPSFTLVLTTMN